MPGGPTGHTPSLSTQPLTILLLSAGSVVGLNILDALEGRRAGLRLVGADCDPRNPQIFRCDKVFLVPPTTSGGAFTARLDAILQEEHPDLVLGSRDDDVRAMAAAWEEQPGWRGRLACGSTRAAGIMSDKLLSFQFASERGLPFADTAAAEAGPGGLDLDALVARHGFPLLAKPRVGCGSRGVYLLHDRGQIERLLLRGGFIFQEYLDPNPGLEAARRDLAVGVPLFFSLPDEFQFACQTAISPRGEVGPVFCSRVRMAGGNPVASEPIRDADLEATARAFAAALAAEGWAGPFNLQCKRRGDGSWAAFEMNGRMTGSTSARLWLGFDEVGDLVRLFVGPGRLPAAPVPEGPVLGMVRTARDAAIPAIPVGILQAEGTWERFS